MTGGHTRRGSNQPARGSRASAGDLLVDGLDDRLAGAVLDLVLAHALEVPDREAVGADALEDLGRLQVVVALERVGAGGRRGEGGWIDDGRGRRRGGGQRGAVEG